MSWVESSLWWQVYPLGFTGAPIRSPHEGTSPRSLASLRPWLDYLVELGVSGLALGPIFESSTHGYDTLDHFRIDPRLGSMATFRRLVGTCHERGVKVMLDGVFNHVGSDHPFVSAVTDAPGPSGEPSSMVRRKAASATIELDTFEGHRSLIALDHGNPKVAEYVESVLRFWLQRGVDAWRLDAAYAMPTSFWAEVLPRVRVDYPDAWFVAEMIHGDYATFVKESTVDAVTQYELWKAIWSSVNDHNFFELDWALQRHSAFVDTFTPHTFVGNHDVTRIAERIGPPGAALALVVLMTVAGIPSIYYGDEQAFVGLKRDEEGGDDEVRPAFPLSPSDLAPWGAWMYRLHQDLIGLRRRHPWLTRAKTRPVVLTNEHYVYDVTSASGEQTLNVDLDLRHGASARITAPNGSVVFAYG